MIIKGTVSVELDADQTADVVVKALLLDYSYDAKEVQDLLAKGVENLEDYERGDLENHLAFMKAVDVVVSNYMLYHEHENFRRTWKKFVDLYDGEWRA
jgi:hypothetical protein